ncbi:MAG: BspA family leucine-rich repeat surface protein [Succinimonas sp.]|nr:BspA family leucine-rich repeat surface protein [Succinimonas sp.]
MQLYEKNARTENDALPTVSQKTLNSIDDVDNELLRSIEKGTLKKLVIAYDLDRTEEKHSPFLRICRITDRIDFDIEFAPEVTSIDSLFEGCVLTSLPKTMDISRIRNVNLMFSDSIIDTPLNLDLKKAETLQGMFSYAEINAPLNLDLKKTETLQGMFLRADINAPLKIDAPSAVSMRKMFETAEINQKITFSPQTRPADVFEMFADAIIQVSPDLDLKKAEDLTGMFRDASIYAPLNINAPSAESMSEMFMGANISAEITFSPEPRPADVRKIFENALVNVIPDISIATDYDLPAMYRQRSKEYERRKAERQEHRPSFKKMAICALTIFACPGP